jgi:uncharacterized integral membrane protein
MSGDAGHGRPGGMPAHGNVGPADPSADPVTDPGVRLPVPAEQPTAPVPVPVPGPATSDPTATGPADAPATDAAPKVRRSRTGVVWVGLILSALVLLFLLVFIVQNNAPVQISFFALQGVLPSGVALLLAAIAGILLGAIPGSVRIFQLRRAARGGPRQR